MPPSSPSLRSPSQRGRSTPQGKSGSGLRFPTTPRSSLPRDCSGVSLTVEFIWGVLDDVGPGGAGEEEWTLDGELDTRRTYTDVLVNRYKDRKLDGSVLFAAVEYCAHIVQHEGEPDQWRQTRRQKEDVPRIMRAVLAAKADLGAEASHSKGRMRAIHYAAGLGVVPVLEALLEAAVERAPPDTSREQCERRILNVRTRDETNQEHYTPIHDAVWFKRFEATRWLLLHGADPDAENVAGWTPMHIVAMQGQRLEFVDLLIRHGADLRKVDRSGDNPLMTAVNKPLFPLSKFHLLAASCYEKKGSFLAYLRDIYTLALENEQAAEEFVQVLLGRHRKGERAANDQLDSESESAMEKASLTEERALRFTQSVDSATARSGDESEKALAMMAEVMEKAPRAAAMILDVLVGTPMVECPEHHPLPLRANMLLDGCEETMLCDYQPDYFEQEDDDDDQELSWMSRVSRRNQKRPTPNKKRAATPLSTGLGSESLDNWGALQKNLLPKVAIVKSLKEEARRKWRLPCWGYDTATNTAPSWHTSIAPMTEKRNDDKEVQVQVLKMPDILDVRVVRVLANTQHLSLFAEKTVQAIVNCLWHQMVKHGVRWAIYLDVVMLATLLAWIMVAEVEQEGLVPLRQSYWIILLATGLKELLNLMYSLYLCHMMDRSVFTYLFYGDVMLDFVATCATLVLAVSTQEDLIVPRVGWRRSLVALNVLMRWFQITYKCRPFSKVGKKIVCVLKSFMPMKEMMFITAVVFFGFAVAVLLIKDNSQMECEHHCSAMVLMNLFKALLMGDGDGFDALTTLPGGDPNGIFAGSLVLLATVVFSVSVLNLLIAVYSNEYDRKEKQSDLLFFQERAGICFRHLMEPLWANWRKRPAWLWRHWERRRGKFLQPEEREAQADTFVKYAMGGLVCFSWVLGLCLGELGWCYTAVACIVATMLLVEVASKRCDWQHPCRTERGDHFYLWICSRPVDFQELGAEDSCRNTQDILMAVRQMSRSLDKQMGELKEGLQVVNSRVDDVYRQLETASSESAPSQPALRLPVPMRRNPPVAENGLRALQAEAPKRLERPAEEAAHAASPRLSPRPPSPSVPSLRVANLGSLPGKLRTPDGAHRANLRIQLPLSGPASPAAPAPLGGRATPVPPSPVQAVSPRAVHRVLPPARAEEAPPLRAGCQTLPVPAGRAEEAPPPRAGYETLPAPARRAAEAPPPRVGYQGLPAPARRSEEASLPRPGHGLPAASHKSDGPACAG